MLFGQGYKATVLGRVTDPSGAAVPGVKIVATNADTNIAVPSQSDAAGDYLIPQLVPGAYRITAEAQGFKMFVRDGVRLNLDQSVRVDVALEVGSVSEEMVVKGEIPVINTENSSLGEVISNAEIQDIPLNGRNYLSLALLAPGVVPATAGANPDNINGARPDHVNYLLDGSTNIERRGHTGVSTPSIDAIQEYKIITNGFSAEYGRLGGGVISVALKNGTNRFHGALYDFLRNDDLDARGFFDPQVPALKRNQFGGVLNGPIVRNKVFFLFSYEGLRARQQQTSVTRVPTQAERAGTFATPIRNPLTGAAFPGNAIPAAQISPIAANILPYFPLPNRAGTLNYVTLAGVQTTSNDEIAKIDYQLRAGDQLSGRYLSNDNDGTNPFRADPIPGFGSHRNTRNQQWGISETHIFSPALINEARLAYVRANFGEVSVNAGKNLAAAAGIQGVAGGYGLPSFSVSGYATVGDPINLPDTWTDNEYAASDTLSLLRGAHSIRMGGDYQRSQHFNDFAAYAGGLLAFNGALSGNALADLLLGLPAATERQVGTNKSYLFSNYFGFFVQDDWKITPRLTLNLGLRWDVNQPPAEKFDHWSNFIVSAGRSVQAGTPGYERALMETHYRNFSPRVGFAYRLDSKGATVLRGGYGIFTTFDLQYTLYQLLGATAYPFTRLEVYSATAGHLLNVSDPFPANFTSTPSGANSPNGWDYRNPTPYMQNWNFTLAHSLPHNFGVQAGYVGSKGTHNSITTNINQTIRTPLANIVPYPGLTRVLLQSLSGNSIYNGLQISLQKRWSDGLTFRSNFTWSKAIDNASFGAGSAQPQDPRNLRAERGLADFNRARVWTNDFIYELPFGRHRKFGAAMSKPVDAFLGGWQLNGILRFYDGSPFTPTVAAANAQLGAATRPDRLGAGTLPNPTITRWFDVSAFAVVPANAFRFGNTGRNIINGPGAMVVDGSLFKEFAMPWEGHRLQFRAEFFNLPNRANFGNPATAVDLPTAGIIGSAQAGRQIQFGLKYLF
jgi:hypothetical protein